MSLFLLGCFTTTPVDTLIHNGQQAFKEAIAINSDTITAIGPEHQIRNKYAGKLTIDLKKGGMFPLINIIHPIAFDFYTKLSEKKVREFENQLLKKAIGSIYINVTTVKQLKGYLNSTKSNSSRLNKYFILTASTPSIINSIMPLASSQALLLQLEKPFFSNPDSAKWALKKTFSSDIQLIIDDTLVLKQQLINNYLAPLLKGANNQKILLKITTTKTGTNKELKKAIKEYTLIPFIKLPKTFLSTVEKKQVKALYEINKVIAIEWEQFPEIKPLFLGLSPSTNSTTTVAPVFWSTAFMWGQVTEHQQMYLKVPAVYSLVAGATANFFIAPFSPLYIDSTNISGFNIQFVFLKGSSVLF